MKTARQLLEIKGKRILSVTSDSPVYDGLVMMAENDVGALMVVDSEQLVGVFSERDYARLVVLKGKSSKTTPVGEIMSRQVVSVSPDHTVEDCMSLMSDKRIRHLPVVHNDQLVGVLSIGDLVKETIAYQQFLIKQLESYIQG